jgi:hypothetical protein
LFRAYDWQRFFRRNVIKSDGAQEWRLAASKPSSYYSKEIFMLDAMQSRKHIYHH